MSALTYIQLILAQTDIPAMHEGGVAFTKLFLRYESLMITAASWVIVQVIQRVSGKLAEHPVFARFKPALPVVLSIGMAFLPSFRLGSWDETLLYGIVLGSLTGFGQKVLKQTLFGQDSRITPTIDDPELKKRVDEHLQAKEAQSNGQGRLRDTIKRFMT